MVGLAVTVTTSSDVEGVQVPLEMVHLKVYDPATAPNIWVVGDVGATMITVDPAVWVQVPVPVPGVFPARLSAENKQLLRADAAAEVLGAA